MLKIKELKSITNLYNPLEYISKFSSGLNKQAIYENI